jgi:hypothetical protein
VTIPKTGGYNWRYELDNIKLDADKMAQELTEQLGSVQQLDTAAIAKLLRNALGISARAGQLREYKG